MGHAQMCRGSSLDFNDASLGIAPGASYDVARFAWRTTAIRFLSLSTVMPQLFKLLAEISEGCQFRPASPNAS